MKKATRNHSQVVTASAPTVKASKKAAKASAVAPTVAKTEKAPKVAAPVIAPAERQATRIAARIAKASPSEGSRARQISHKEKTVRAFGFAGAEMGLTETETFNAYVAPHALDAATLGTLADAADRARNKAGLRSPYFRGRNFSKVAFNADAPAFTLAELAPTIKTGIALGFSDFAALSVAKA